MRRREFITLLGGTAAWPFAAGAQQPERIRRVGVLSPLAGDDPEAASRSAAFREALQDLGWSEGTNIQIDFRWGAGDPARMRALAKELVGQKPDALATNSTPAVALLREATSTIPIVFVQVADPVGSGFVANFAKPGSNITGFSNFEASMAGKWLELLKEISPGITRIGLLFNPDTLGVGQYYVRPVEAAAPSLGVETIAVRVHDLDEMERAIDAFGGQSNGGLVVLPEIFTAVHRERIVALAARWRLPAIYGFRYFVTSGGLMSYGVETTDIWRRSAGYVDRILRGAKPGDLPVQAPTKFEFVINLKTAKALGLTVPQTMLVAADEVIE